MKFDQFAYWLQGPFEFQKHYSEKSLTDTDFKPILTATQVICIKNHIQLHFECCLREDIEPHQFICWLDGSLRFYDKLPIESQEELVVEIQKRLDNLFIHQIDPEMPGDKDSLQDIHDGNSDGKGEKKPAFGRPASRGRSLERRSNGGNGRRLMC